MLNLEKYAKQKKEKEKNKKKCYKNILKQVNAMIEKNMDQSMDHVIYKAPTMLFDETDYDMLESINYIINKIIKDKEFEKILVDMKFIEPNILFIKWDLEKL